MNKDTGKVKQEPEVEELRTLDELAEGGPEDFVAGEGDIDANVEKVIAERDEFHDRWMRALAEAENARKRGDKARREAELYGGQRLARDMLPVYDNLRRALDAAEDAEGEASKALLEGVELTLREMRNVFKKHGIEPVSPELGDIFDPQTHEAMFEAPVPGTKAGEIIQVMAEGFMIGDRLLRPAKVGVSSTPAS